jgi:hypothetical protein
MPPIIHARGIVSVIKPVHEPIRRHSVLLAGLNFRYGRVWEEGPEDDCRLIPLAIAWGRRRSPRAPALPHALRRDALVGLVGPKPAGPGGRPRPARGPPAAGAGGGARRSRSAPPGDGCRGGRGWGGGRVRPRPSRPAAPMVCDRRLSRSGRPMASRAWTGAPGDRRAHNGVVLRENFQGKSSTESDTCQASRTFA